MSVLIRGMEMPKSCHACCFFGQADIWESDFDGYTKSFCKRTGSQTYDYVDKFLPNCPLVPVPPHDDLIDRSVAYDKIAEQEGGNYVDMDVVDKGLEATPVIIPAEEEES